MAGPGGDTRAPSDPRGSTVSVPRPTDAHPEEFFRRSDYWQAWSRVPDSTADIPYALAALKSADRSVLDVPCGRGRLLKAAATHRPDVQLTCFDVNLDMVRQARAVVPAARAAVASVYALPLRDRAVDLVLCHESFMHFADPRAALAELTRVARTGVYLSVTTRRQLNTLLRLIGALGTSRVPHWTYDLEDLWPLLPHGEFEWRVVGAFLLGPKALRLSHSAYRRLHGVFGRLVPQWVLRRFGQTLFVYGRRIAGGRS